MTNDARTCAAPRTPQAQRGSGPVLFELIDKDGKPRGKPSSSVRSLMLIAEHLWPNQQQDEDRTGKGWDIQVAGAK